jgi:hypothetical protein
VKSKRQTPKRKKQEKYAHHQQRDEHKSYRRWLLAQRGPAATKKNNRSRNGTLTEFFICFISVSVHFREPKIFAFSAKISL